MADIDLETYKMELQQVQAALLNDPSNGQLLKLATDLRDVIALTSQLAKPKDAQTQWKVGDACEAVWSVDGQYYKAVIDSMSDDGTCTVTFSEYSQVEIVQLSSLRAVGGGKASGKKRPTGDSEPLKTEKELTKAEREEIIEAKKRRREKKKDRMEQIEKAVEGEKSKWTNFTSKRGVKSSSSAWTDKPKKSIFASPDSADGKVGVGTCGIAGKGMTDYANREKWTFEKE